uniref:Uncharacterized protein n=1 Tax=Ralstonia solanacearum TaxID=305 RepID=A0A0S4V4Z2_RALSL|nr:protein of unknown function [Ralstonia solanacearum]
MAKLCVKMRSKLGLEKIRAHFVMRLAQAQSCCIAHFDYRGRYIFRRNPHFSKHVTPDWRAALISLPIAFAMHRAETGISVEEACRKIGISQATFMRGRKSTAAGHDSPDRSMPRPAIRGLMLGLRRCCRQCAKPYPFFA